MHVYPAELVAHLLNCWESTAVAQDASKAPFPLPPAAALEHLIATCYQVSMMREEGRRVTLRLILVDPDLFPAHDGPPVGFHRLLFTTPLPFNEYELRNLSPSVDFERSLLGIQLHPEKGCQIWGIINSGLRWLQQERGGSRKVNQLPDALVLQLPGPGMLTVCRGSRIVATLSGGRLANATANPFQSAWIRRLYAPQHAALLTQHETFRASVRYPVARIDANFIASLQFQMFKRIISVTRMARHGGTFLIFPEAEPAELAAENPMVLLSYRLQDDKAIRRQRRLLMRTIRLATTAMGDSGNPDRLVTWQDYLDLRTRPAIYELEEAFYEQAQFVAGLAAVEGAVVLGERGVLGFGAIIVASFSHLTEVGLAGDNEGKVVRPVPIEDYGSRHYSTYQLCNSCHGMLAIIVSQDAGVQLCTWRNGLATCWHLTAEMFVNNT